MPVPNEKTEEPRELGRLGKLLSGILIITVVVILLLGFAPGVVQYALGLAEPQYPGFCIGGLGCWIP